MLYHSVTGKLFALDHEGKVLDQFRLPDGVKCIVADDDWLAFEQDKHQQLLHP